MPEFSIVIPTYNREREVVRAIESCLLQEGADFEVIVVDDASTDRSCANSAKIRDSRLKLLRHSVNRGSNAARNTGVRSAAGQWFVILDSDDELAPGALATMKAAAAATGNEVQRIAFMYRRDDGRVTPSPALREELIDYPGYVRWLEGRQYYDFMSCTRTTTFKDVSFPEGRWSDQALYNLDFAKRYVTLFREEIVAVVHTDADNRLSYLRRSRKHSRATAARLGRELDELLQRHGDAMRSFAPHTFQMFRRMRASYHFLEGRRVDGVKEMVGCLRATPLLAEAWLLLIVGTLGGGAFATVRSWRSPAA